MHPTNHDLITTRVLLDYFSTLVTQRKIILYIFVTEGKEKEKKSTPAENPQSKQGEIKVPNEKNNEKKYI